MLDGVFKGEEDGGDCGLKLGDRVGIAVGRLVGIREGFPVGDRVGIAEGRFVGLGEGFSVGDRVGVAVGRLVGRGEGFAVGYSVCIPLILRVFIIKSRNNLKLIDPRPVAGSQPGAASNP